MLYISSVVYVKCWPATQSEAVLCIFKGVRTVVGSQILLYFSSPAPLRRLSLSPPFVSKLQCILLLFKENIVSIADIASVLGPTEGRHRQLCTFPNFFSWEQLQRGYCLTSVSFSCEAEVA